MPIAPTRLLSGFLLAAAFIGFVPGRLRAQVDAIRGVVTSTEGIPLAGVRVTATSIPGNVTREIRSDARGAYQIAFTNGPGDYAMGFALIGYAYQQFEIKRIADEAVLIADARLAPVMLDTVSVHVGIRQKVKRVDLTPDVSGTEQPINGVDFPPELRSDFVGLTASLPGVLLLPGSNGGLDGFSVFGLGADENSITLNGLRFGGPGIPRDAAFSASLSTSPYDVTRGRFSGANLNLTAGSGSNTTTRGMSVVFNTPRLQWTDPAARSQGAQYRGVSVGGIASGPIAYNRSFYNVSYQFDRSSRDTPSLLGSDRAGLAAAGVSSDSAMRLVDILEQLGVPIGHPTRGSTRESGFLFGRIDLTPATSAVGQTLSLGFNGSFDRRGTVGEAVTQLASALGDRTSWSSGLQASHSQYLKLILSETDAGITVSQNSGDAYLDFPAGRVRVNSRFESGAIGVQTLGFGGSQSLASTGRSLTGSVQNTLSWFDDDNRHRLKLRSELQYEAISELAPSNLLGTFYFNSLGDLEAGRPASFSRQLTGQRQSTGLVTGALSLGDTYRRSPELQLQYGVRVDLSRFTTRPMFNPTVESALGRRNDRTPWPLSVSPRLGFSWIPSAQVPSLALRGPRAVIRGGIGVFSNTADLGQIGNAVRHTGLPTGVQQLECIGVAAPTPNWSAYARDSKAIPDQCADGTSGTVFANPSPSVALIAPAFAPVQSVRSNVSWSGSMLGARLATSIEATYSLNLHRQRLFDVNFDPTPRFTVPTETGRPVFVEPTSIVASTGRSAFSDSRVSPQFADVTELRSDLRSRTAQLGFRVSPIVRSPSPMAWSVAYTFTGIREQVDGFRSTAGSPLEVAWGTAGQGPHQITYSLRYTIFGTLAVSWNGVVRSGSAFTPMIGGDVNGDGRVNDRAFVFAPAGSVGDSSLRDGMRQLLSDAPAATRRCLERQFGQIARQNSCRGPWNSVAWLNMRLDRARFRMPRRADVQFSLSNPLGALDLALHGSGKLRGWGQTPFVDPVLLHVRGFDPTLREFKYEVNQRFGETRRQLVTLHSPVMLTTTVRIDLGPTRQRQRIIDELRLGRYVPGSRSPEIELRRIGTQGVVNPMIQILELQDSLRLTRGQADSIARMNRRYLYRADSIWGPASRNLHALPERFDEGDAYARFAAARRAQVDMLTQLVPLVRVLLTSEQMRKLPAATLLGLDTRYLALIRNGTGEYVGPGAITR